MAENKELLRLFNEESDVENLKEILDIDTGNVPLGMTAFQINNFVLNRKEFPSDLMQFQHAKLEIHTRIQYFADLYYQYREAKAKIKLAEARIEQIKSEPLDSIPWSRAQAYKELREAKTELHEIEIEKNRFRLKNIQYMAKEKLREAMVFYQTYTKFKEFESMKPEELAELEEEGWKIKSAYYPELQHRYSLTPEGFVPLPHEKDRLKVISENMEGDLNAATRKD